MLVDMNGNKLYQQSFLDKGNWKLPFSWGSSAQSNRRWPR